MYRTTITRVLELLFSNCLAAAVYFLWRERNGRVFRGRGVSSEWVVKDVFEAVKACIWSWRGIPPIGDDQRICSAWGAPSQIFHPNVILFPS